jgi:hypothetical protein
MILDRLIAHRPRECSGKPRATDYPRTIRLYYETLLKYDRDTRDHAIFRKIVGRRESGTLLQLPVKDMTYRKNPAVHNAVLHRKNMTTYKREVYSCDDGTSYRCTVVRRRESGMTHAT